MKVIIFRQVSIYFFAYTQAVLREQSQAVIIVLFLTDCLTPAISCGEIYEWTTELSEGISQFVFTVGRISCEACAQLQHVSFVASFRLHYRLTNFSRLYSYFVMVRFFYSSFRKFVVGSNSFFISCFLSLCVCCFCVYE